MPLLLVFLDDIPHLRGKAGMKLRQTHGNILVYRGLADAEDGGGLPDGRTVLRNICAEAHGTVVQCLRTRGCGIKLLFVQ